MCPFVLLTVWHDSNGFGSKTPESHCAYFTGWILMDFLLTKVQHKSCSGEHLFRRLHKLFSRTKVENNWNVYKIPARSEDHTNKKGDSHRFTCILFFSDLSSQDSLKVSKHRIWHKSLLLILSISKGRQLFFVNCWFQVQLFYPAGEPDGWMYSIHIPICLRQLLCTFSKEIIYFLQLTTVFCFGFLSSSVLYCIICKLINNRR